MNVFFFLDRHHRTWKPNIQTKSFRSELFGESLRLRVSTAALRWIERDGGIDNYLLNTPDHKIDSALGSKLRRLALAVQAKRAEIQAAADAAPATTAATAEAPASSPSTAATGAPPPM